MFELTHNAESRELSDALEKFSQKSARLKTIINTVPSFLVTSLPEGSKDGTGHNVPQETPQTFAQAMIDIDSY